jgi:dienelactone hydrolase
MAEVVVFHHALGITGFFTDLADTLRGAGHTVHMPDLLGGRTFPTIEEGVAYSEELGGPMAVVQRARTAVESLPNDAVYIGFSLGVLAAQSLAQTRPGAKGAVLVYSALPLGEWGDAWPSTWPDGVRLQVHILEGDEDFEFAKELTARVAGSELFVYGGAEHYFAEHDPAAAVLLAKRILDLLAHG